MKIFQFALAFVVVVVLSINAKAQQPIGPETTGGGAGTTEGNPLFDNNMPNVIPPEPKVAELMKFDEIKLNEYTGTPNIKVDLYKTNISQNLNLDISLSYDINALSLLRKNDLYGVGWLLNGRSVISRTVVGSPDDKIDTIITPLNAGPHSGAELKMIGLLMPQNDVYNLNNLPDENQQEVLWNTLYPKYTKLDKDPDVFQISLFGYSQKFNLVKDQNDLTKIIPVVNGDDQHLKIEPITNQDHLITSFKVTTPDSYVFYFEEIGTTTSTSTTNTVLYSGSTSISNTDNFTAITSWSLSRIENSSGELLAAYSYTNNTTTKIDVSKSTTNNIIDLNDEHIQGPVGPSGTSFPNAHLASLPPKATFTTNILKFESNELSEIDIIGKEKIKFNYNTFNVNYFDYINNNHTKNVPYLYNITVENNSGAQVRDINFTYEFSNTPATVPLEESFPNFFLMSVNDIFGLTTFTYSEKENLPNYLGKKENYSPDYYMRDKWGFYNGDKSGQFSLYQTMVDKNKIKTGALIQITKPTGGKINYNWEPNTFSYLGSEIIQPEDIPENYSYQVGNNNGVDILLRTQPNSGCMNSGVETGTFTTSGGPISYNYNIILNDDGDNDNYDYSTGNFNNILSNYVINLHNINTSTDYPIQISNGVNPTNVLHSIPAGSYTVSLQQAEPFFSIEACQLALQFSLISPFYEEKFNYMTGGGLRIQSIEYLDTDDSVQDYRRYNYHDKYFPPNQIISQEELSSVKSYGSYDGSFSPIEYFNENKAILISNDNSTGEHTLQPYVTKITDQHSVDVTQTAGSFIGYSQVSVHREDLGYEVKTFISPKEDSQHPEFNPNNPPVNDKDYRRGKLLSHKIYDANDKILKETINEYSETIHNQYNFTNIFESVVSPNCAYISFYETYSQYSADPPLPQAGGQSFPPGLTASMISDATSGCWSNTFIGSTSYMIESGKFHVTKTVSKDYFYTGNEPTDIDGIPIPENYVKTTQDFEYYPQNGKLKRSTTTINENNTAEVQVVNHYYANNTSDFDNSLFTTSQLQNIQKLVDIHNINQLVYKTTEANSKKVTSITRFKEFSADQVLPSEQIVFKDDNSPASTIYFNRYDSKGNILEVSTKSADMLINGPNYDDAKIVSYLYGYGRSKPIAKLVGVRYQDIESLPATNNQYSNYIEQLQALSNNDFDNWMTTNSNEEQLRNALDELRNFFPEAFITTLSHDPIRGVTTNTDPRGNTTYYRHDNKGRLLVKLDNDMKIIEQYSYNYGN